MAKRKFAKAVSLAKTFQVKSSSAKPGVIDVTLGAALTGLEDDTHFTMLPGGADDLSRLLSEAASHARLKVFGRDKDNDKGEEVTGAY